MLDQYATIGPGNALLPFDINFGEKIIEMKAGTLWRFICLVETPLRSDQSQKTAWGYRAEDESCGATMMVEHYLMLHKAAAPAPALAAFVQSFRNAFLIAI